MPLACSSRDIRNCCRQFRRRRQAFLYDTSKDQLPRQFATISGAHLYGFPSYPDYDLRGAHVLALDAVVGLEVRDETVQDLRAIDG